MISSAKSLTGAKPIMTLAQGQLRAADIAEKHAKENIAAAEKLSEKARVIQHKAVENFASAKSTRDVAHKQKSAAEGIKSKINDPEAVLDSNARETAALKGAAMQDIAAVNLMHGA